MMQITPVNFVADFNQSPKPAEQAAVTHDAHKVEPASEQSSVQIKPDLSAVGTEADADDLRAAREEWLKMQAAKAAAEHANDNENSAAENKGMMQDDLAQIALAAQSGNAAAVLIAQQRLAQHVLKL